MSRFDIPHVVCDKCGEEEQTRTTPDGWQREIVWSFKDFERDEMTHVSHNHAWHSVDGHLCDTCVSEANQLPLDFRGVPEEEFCSWCGSQEIIGTVGSAAEGYSHVTYGICKECSPFQF